MNRKPLLVASLLAAQALAVDAQAQGLTNPIPAPIAKGSTRIQLHEIAAGLTAPNYLTHAGDGTDRLFVVDQAGAVRLIKNGQLTPQPFLDVTSRLPTLGAFGPGTFDERGLLGLAFHPDFGTPGTTGFGKLYTFNSEPVGGAADFTVTLPAGTAFNHQSVVAEWQVSNSNPDVVDPSSRRELMRVDKPQFNHNAGMIAFGPDRQLYIALGDGGGANDNQAGHGTIGNGQDPTNVLGTILRIDPQGSNSANGQYGVPGSNPFVGDASAPDKVDEIYAYGFRNPFRFSFDGATGRLVVADVGQRNIEEVDIVTPGGNFGWRLKEGTFAFNPSDGSVSTDLSGIPPGLSLIDPVLQYDHDEGISIIGGFVYRGTAIPELQGKYIFGDFSRAFTTASGRLFAGDLDTGEIMELIIGAHDDPLGMFVKGFGEDASGELYLLAGTNLAPFGTDGRVFALEAVPLPAPVWLLGSALAALLATRRRRGGQAYTL